MIAHDVYDLRGIADSRDPCCVRQTAGNHHPAIYDSARPLGTEALAGGVYAASGNVPLPAVGMTGQDQFDFRRDKRIVFRMMTQQNVIAGSRGKVF